MVAAASGLGCLKVFFACLAPTHGAAGNLRQVGEINAQRGFFDRRLDGYLLNRRYGRFKGSETACVGQNLLLAVAYEGSVMIFGVGE